MTIELTYDDFFIEQFQEAEEEELQWDASDNLDVTYKFDTRISQGWIRNIRLREGLRLLIDRHQPIDQLTISRSEEEWDSILCLFTLSGKGQGRIPSTLNETLRPYTSGKYSLRSTGLFSREISNVISHSNKEGLMRKPSKTQDYPSERAGGEHPDEAMSSKRWSTAFFP